MHIKFPPQDLREGRDLPDLNEPCAREEEVGVQEAILHPADEMQDDVLPGLNEAFGEEVEAALHEYGMYADAIDAVFDQYELDDSSDDDEQPAQEIHMNQCTNMTEIQRLQIYLALLEMSTNGKLKKNSTRIVANIFNTSIDTVQRIWKRAKECRAQGIPVDVRSRKAKKCGRKKVQVDLAQVASVPLNQRSTIRSLAAAIGVSKSTVHRWFKKNLLRRHSNALKPKLTEQNKKERLQWCVRMLDHTTLPNDPKFIEMENIVHLDEKWFNATTKRRNFYLLPQEEDPYRAVQNKNSIDKLMFLSAVAKPRRDNEGNCTFDGKIGVWAFVTKEPAQRRSINRARGTLVTKPIKVDRETMRSYMIAKLLPAIVAKWPREDDGKAIFIQQDNAPSHVPANDEQFRAAVALTGLDIRIVSQPPNSLDMNALDLGFFASLQSLTTRSTSRNMDELIHNVENAYNDYNPEILNKVFLTLQGCLIEVMKDNGGNRYKVPHMHKDRLHALGILPKRLSCERQLYESVMMALGT